MLWNLFNGAHKYAISKERCSVYILTDSLRVILTHCCSHNPQVKLASPCKIQETDNILEQYKNIKCFSMAQLKEKNC